jgi:hypothetical protein
MTQKRNTKDSQSLDGWFEAGDVCGRDGVQTGLSARDSDIVLSAPAGPRAQQGGVEGAVYGRRERRQHQQQASSRHRRPNRADPDGC